MYYQTTSILAIILGICAIWIGILGVKDARKSKRNEK